MARVDLEAELNATLAYADWLASARNCRDLYMRAGMDLPEPMRRVFADAIPRAQRKSTPEAATSNTGDHSRGEDRLRREGHAMSDALRKTGE